MGMYTVIIIALMVFAIFDTVVGVANDAVNFLNSAFGSKVTSRKVILAIAAVGIMVGTLTSTGMMEVARSGVFYPAQFQFSEVMILFLGMIVGDIILLSVFNSLGLPTSTTVSMVFGLLGAALAVSIHKISTTEGLTIADLPQFINTGKAMAIISAILLSVVLAFIFGMVLMFISRLIFSFRYNRVFKRLGALWCGISFTGIIFFALFKGLHNSGIIAPVVLEFISGHLALSLLGIWLASSLILFVFQLLKVNILKVTILAGTFALALAFAGNDLVNFIGVPLAGLDSYKMAVASGDIQMMMTGLAEPAKADFLILIGTGIVMVLTLIFSKKAMHVTETEISLSSQNEGQERFGSSMLSRGLVRATIIMSNWYMRVIPQRMKNAIDERFKPLPPSERGDASYDWIRATVNLTAASILISLATSLKLPLSTTYVVFMVAMGSSLADRAWGRESAVYRITGVMTVIAGWFVTALSALVISSLITSFLAWDGWVAVITVILLCLAMMARRRFKKKTVKTNQEQKYRKIVLGSSNAEEIMHNCTEDLKQSIGSILVVYNKTLAAMSKENRRSLKCTLDDAEEMLNETRERKYDIIVMVKKLRDNDIDTGHFYVQVIDSLSEVIKALVHIVRPAYEHVSNNHEGLSSDQVLDLMRVNDKVEEIFQKVVYMLENNDYSDMDSIFEMRDNLFDKISAAISDQIQWINDDNKRTPTKASVLYLNTLNETKTMVLNVRNLIKSQSYFCGCERK